MEFEPLLPQNYEKSKQLKVFIPFKYPGKMTYKIADYVIKRFVNEGQTVLDPFCGSGSVLQASFINNVHSIGIDINPLAAAYSEVNGSIYYPSKLYENLELLTTKVNSLGRRFDTEYSKRLLYWFNKDVLDAISDINDAINDELRGKHKIFFKSVLASIVRRFSRADPKIYPPVYSKYMRSNPHEYGYDDLLTSFEYTAMKFIEMIKERKLLLNSKYSPKVIQGDAFEYLARNRMKFDYIFTSPPYGFAQKYVRSTSLELMTIFGLTGKELSVLNSKDIGSETYPADEFDYLKMLPNWLRTGLGGSIESKKIIGRYLYKISRFVELAYYGLKPDGNLLLLIGQNKIGGKTVPTVKYLKEVADRIGFETKGMYHDEIKSYSFFTKRNGNSSIIRTEFLLVLTKKE